TCRLPPLPTLVPYTTLFRSQPDDHVETGGLARAVGAEQSDNLPAFDGQTDVAYDLAALVALGEVLGFQDGHYSPCSAVGASVAGVSFLRGWITMSTRGRGVVMSLLVARP